MLCLVAGSVSQQLGALRLYDSSSRRIQEARVEPEGVSYQYSAFAITLYSYRPVFFYVCVGFHNLDGLFILLSFSRFRFLEVVAAFVNVFDEDVDLNKNYECIQTSVNTEDGTIDGLV